MEPEDKDFLSKFKGEYLRYVIIILILGVVIAAKLTEGFDWGSLLGGIIGGLLTLVGVLLTLNKQDKDSIKQNKELYLQRFESTFYQLIFNLNGIVNSIFYNDSVKGRSYFGVAYTALITEMYRHKQIGFSWNSLKINSEEDRAKYTGLDYYSQQQQYIGIWLKNIYEMLSFIDRSNLSVQQKRTYASVLKAQLNNEEFLVLFYIAINFDKVGVLFQRYGLNFELDVDRLLDPSHIGLVKYMI